VCECDGVGFGGGGCTTGAGTGAAGAAAHGENQGRQKRATGMRYKRCCRQQRTWTGGDGAKPQS